MYIIGAILLGLAYNFFFGGFSFNPTLCFVAGLFLIMPALLKFKFKDFKVLEEYKNITIINLVLNFLAIPAIFYLVGTLFFDTSYIKYAFLLLGLLSGGGLLLSWVGKTKGNMKLAFSLFALNLFIFSFLFFPLNAFFLAEGKDYLASTPSSTQSFLNLGATEQVGCVIAEAISKCGFDMGHGPSPIASFLALIGIPFIISRLIRLNKKAKKYISERIKPISSVVTFFIIFYIFSLKEVSNIFDFDSFFIFKTAGVLLFTYTLVYLLMYAIYAYNNKTPEYRSLLWVSSTRFITLGVIFSLVYSAVFGVEFLMIFSIAYFVQIFLSFMFLKILQK